jgi:hypothetical protein
MLENTKTVLGVISATIGIAVGGYSLVDEIGFNKDILTWAPDHFKITGGPADGEFEAIVAREKHRDDCSVTGFKLEIRDSNYMVYPVTPSATKFSGPASDTIDKFGYKFYLHETDIHKVAPGLATLSGQISYNCPEGEVFIHYPPNLTFMIEPV